MKKQYKHLTIEEMAQIAISKQEGRNIRQIAVAIEHNHGTISRELRQNQCVDRLEYYPRAAHSLVSIRRSQNDQHLHAPYPLNCLNNLITFLIRNQPLKQQGNQKLCHKMMKQRQ